MGEATKEATKAKGKATTCKGKGKGKKKGKGRGRGEVQMKNPMSAKAELVSGDNEGNEETIAEETKEEAEEEEGEGDDEVDDAGRSEFEECFGKSEVVAKVEAAMACNEDMDDSDNEPLECLSNVPKAMKAMKAKTMKAMKAMKKPTPMKYKNPKAMKTAMKAMKAMKAKEAKDAKSADTLAEAGPNELLADLPAEAMPDEELNGKRNYTKALEGHVSKIQVLLEAKAFYVTAVEEIPSTTDGLFVCDKAPAKKKGVHRGGYKGRNRTLYIYIYVYI